MDGVDNGTVFLTYLTDSDVHPWENGNGRVYLVEGLVNGSVVEWDEPFLVKDLDVLNLSCNPVVSFVNGVSSLS